MISFLQKNYTALIKGGIVTIFLSSALIVTNYIILAPGYVTGTIISFIFLWLVLSFLTYQFSVYKISGIVGLLVAVMLVEKYINIPINPIVIPLMILFWLGVAYFVSPHFFKKYKIAIFSVYGLILSYFLFFNMAPNDTKNHHQDFLNFLLIPIPVFAASWVYEQWRWLKTLQADKAKAELALLKSQINPHFFFNTLNNLYGLVVEKSEEAPVVVLKLSDMMRYTIYQGKKDLVLLKDEISYLENYIELHKIRYHKKVEISFTHDVLEGLKVAPLLFIILLENAFKHGVEKMHEDAFIHLRMQSQGKQLCFTIENSFDPLGSKHNNGIGLENLKKRLDHTYHNQHELIIEEKESPYKVQLNLKLI